MAPDGDNECTAAPAACVGATAPLPGQATVGTSGAVGADAGCIARAVTTGTGQTQSDSLPYCTTDTDGDGITDTGTPPPPPTHGEIVATTCPTIPTPTLGLNPPRRGITGLATWIWDDSQPTSRTTTGTIRGYPVTCTTTPTLWTVDTGDPTATRFGHPRTRTAHHPGRDAEDTPIQHTYETKGTVTLTLTVTWDRRTSAGRDTPTRTTTTDYRLQEIRAVPTTPA